MGAKQKDLVGSTFSNLTVLSLKGSDKFKKRIWNCECSCGNNTTASSGQLSTGSKKSSRCKNCGSYSSRVEEVQSTAKNEYDLADLVADVAIGAAAGAAGAYLYDSFFGDD